MNTTTRCFQLALGTLLLASVAIAQEAPPPVQKQPENTDAAVQKGIQWLNRNHAVDLQFDNSLSLLLASKLVSSNDLGVDLAEIQPSLRAQLNLAEGAGLVVTAVPDDSPGAKAGLKPHDVLVNIGTTSVDNLAQVAEALQKAQGESADKTAMLGIVRQGKSLTVKAVPKSPWVAELAFADVPVTAWSRVNVNVEPRYRIGVVLSEADDTLRAQVGLAAGEGLIVTEVFPDAPAAKVGIQPHDVLVILDGKRLSAVDAVNAQIQEIKEREVELKLLRGGKELLLKIAPQKESTEATTVDGFHRALTIWSAGACPAAQAQSRQCTSCHADPFPEWKHPKAVNDYHALRQWILMPQAAAGSPQEQVNQLKEQLAKMQETLSTLEAALQSAATKEESQPKPEEKK
jgi:serine protease Do